MRANAIDIFSYDEHTRRQPYKRKLSWWEGNRWKTRSLWRNYIYIEKKIKTKKKYCKQNGKLFNKKFVNVTSEPIIFRLFNLCQGLECVVVTIHTNVRLKNADQMNANQHCEKGSATAVKKPRSDRTHSNIGSESCHFRKTHTIPDNGIHEILNFEHF